MNPRTPWKSAGIVIVLFIIGLIAIGESAHAQLMLAPSSVRFTGIFFTPGNVPKTVRGIGTYRVNIAGKREWDFVIMKAQNLSQAETSRGILRDVFPRRLRFRGDGEALKLLQDPAIEGKSLTVLGSFYRDERRLNLDHAEILEEDKE